MARQPPKCCCCVPLRPGLLAWAYIKLVLALTSIGGFVYFKWHEIRYLVADFDNMLRFDGPVFILGRFWPLGVCLLLLVFAIIFIFGVHRQNYKLLLVFLVYSVFEVILGGAAVGWQVYSLISRLRYYSEYDSETYYRFLYYQLYNPVWYLQLIIPLVFNILLPIYFSVLIKREVQRLKRARGETRDRRQPLFPVEELERLRQQLGVKNV